MRGSAVTGRATDEKSHCPYGGNPRVFLSEVMMDRYPEVEKLIYRIVHNHQRRYGGEWDELLSLAHLGYALAARSYDPRKGSFAKRIGFLVHRFLIERFRGRKTISFVPLCEDCPVYSREDRWQSFFMDLSPVAREAVNYALTSLQPIGKIGDGM